MGVPRINTESLVYEAVDANLAAGVMVIPSNTATVSGRQGIKVATDAAVNPLGVSAAYAVTEANRAALENTTGADGWPVTSLAVPDATVTVYDWGVVPLTYTAVAVAYGVKLCCAAAGAVRAWVSGTDPASSVIGFCAEPGGVSSAGGVAKVFVRI